MSTPASQGGRRIVITAPLTEIIDHAGYFIQMSMASLPMWLEGILNRKYPDWRKVEYNGDGTARYMPAGARVLEASLALVDPRRRTRPRGGRAPWPQARLPSWYAVLWLPQLGSSRLFLELRNTAVPHQRTLCPASGCSCHRPTSARDAQESASEVAAKWTPLSRSSA